MKSNSFNIKGTALGEYIIQDTLGNGTFGRVKLAIHLPTRRKVAIKILEKNKIVEKDDLDRVIREMNILRNFSHPNVIQVFEILEDNEKFYIIMEYCELGELFNTIVHKKRLSEDEAAVYFFQIINGLEHIHADNVVHRDLKPENLLLNRDNIIKIIDFGLSNYFSSDGGLLVTPCGSPCYASPEMVAGKKYNGFKIDIWSTGIILYAMLCGFLPFEDQNNEILFQKILQCNLDFPYYITSLAKDMIKKLLHTDPEKRIEMDEIKRHQFYIKGQRNLKMNIPLWYINSLRVEKQTSSIVGVMLKGKIQINK